jgi:NADH-quinone oxidoreductase subunit B
MRRSRLHWELRPDPHDGSGLEERTVPRADSPLVPSMSGMRSGDGGRFVELLRQGSDSFQTSRADSVVGWARKYSMFPYPFLSGCCSLELTSTAGPRYDLDRFGCSLPRFSPRQSDLLLVVGTITHRQAPILKQVYDQMAEPKWVMAFGACACSGGPYDNYATVQGIDTLIPVDVYVPGCPPRPEAFLDGLMKLQARVQCEPVPADGRHRESETLRAPPRPTWAP